MAAAVAPRFDHSTMKKIMEEFQSTYDPLRNNDEGVPLGKFRDQWLPAWLPIYWPQIKNFPLKADDIVVSSFPKSGTNWLHYIVYLVATQNFEQALNSDQRMLLELPKPPLPSTLERLAALPGQRFLATHLCAPLLPKDVFNAKLIYIYRNPKDVAVSFYYHNIAMANDKWTFSSNFEQFVEQIMDGKVMFGPLPQHLKGYLDLKNQGKPMLMLRYEDVKKDPKATINQIAQFLGKELDDATIEKIIEASSVSKMRENNDLNWSEHKQAGIWKKDHEFIRKGQVGDWRNHFTNPELLARFDQWVEDNFPAEMIAPSDI